MVKNSDTANASDSIHSNVRLSACAILRAPGGFHTTSFAINETISSEYNESSSVY